MKMRFENKTFMEGDVMEGVREKMMCEAARLRELMEGGGIRGVVDVAVGNWKKAFRMGGARED